MSLHTFTVEHLVVDANALINNTSLWQIGKNVYCVEEVKKEIRDQNTKQRLRNQLFELILKKPSELSVNRIIAVSKATGDYSVLSLADINLLALTLDLHIEHIGLEGVNLNVKSITELVEEAEDDIGNSKTNPVGFVDDSDDEGDWIDEETFTNALDDLSEEDKKDPVVACMSADFAIQNVLLQMNLFLLAVDSRRIRELRSYLLRCRSCYRLIHDMEKIFCPKCGNKTLHRVHVTVDRDGNTNVHLDQRKLEVMKGLNKVQRSIKGGKHDNCDIFFESQRLPQNRLAKIHQSQVSDSPFAMNDVTSRSAILGIRTQFHSRGDPEQFSHPKGRKGKRRN